MAKIQGKGQALDRMVELGKVATETAKIIALRDVEIAKINERFGDNIDAGAKRITALKKDLREWAADNEKAEAQKDTRLIVFDGVGYIQLRTGNPEVRLQRGVNEETAIRRLFDAGFGQFVRTVQELDREGIIAARAEPGFERVELCGVKVGQSEGASFEIEGVGRV
jgi:phage host-nuclease inhibitor protein Gam